MRTLRSLRPSVLPSSPPHSFHLPPSAHGVAAELDELAVGADAAVGLAGIGILPLAAGDAVGTGGGDECVLAGLVAIADRDREALAIDRFRGDGLGLGEEIERDLGIGVAGADLGAGPDECGMFLDPPGAAAGERMARALGAERRAVAVEHARQRLGRRAGTREAAVEDVALHALGTAHGVHGEGEAGDAVLEDRKSGV